MKIFSRKTNLLAGMVTLELLIAMSLLVMTLGSVVMLVFGGQNNSVSSETYQEALYLAEHQIEYARAALRADFNSTPAGLPSNSIYTSNLIINADPDGLTKTITSVVSWSGKQISLSTKVTNWNPADLCSSTLTGDWQTPKLLSTANFADVNGATGIFTTPTKLYATANPSSGSHEDFYILDITDPHTSMPIIDKINTGPGLAGVVVYGHYAYVANTSTGSQMQVIDISVSPPVLKKNIDLTQSGDTAVGNAIFYFNKKIYLGLTKSSTGPEFYVFDVSTNPIPSLPIASFEINSQVTSMVVRNGFAYLAVPDDASTPLLNEQLKVLDVSHSSAGVITLVNNFGPNPNTLSGQGLYLSKDGKTLYLGEGGANPGHKPEFMSLDVSSPTSPLVAMQSKYLGSTGSAVIVRNNFAFLATSDTSKGFQVLDLDHLANPNPYGSVNIQQATGGMSCNGNIIFVAQHNMSAIQAIGPG